MWISPIRFASPRSGLKAVLAMSLLASGAMPVSAGALCSCHQEAKAKRANRHMGEPVQELRVIQRVSIFTTMRSVQMEDQQANGNTDASRGEIIQLIATCKADLEADLAALRGGDPCAELNFEEVVLEQSLLKDLDDLASIAKRLNVHADFDWNGYQRQPGEGTT